MSLERSRIHPGLALLLIVLWPGAGAAQTVASSFDELQNVLKTGETVSVTDDSGRRTKGKVVDLSASSLVLLVGRKDQSRVFTVDGTTKIVRHDSLDNGVLIGLGAGAASGWGWLRAACGPLVTTMNALRTRAGSYFHLLWGLESRPERL